MVNIDIQSDGSLSLDWATEQNCIIDLTIDEGLFSVVLFGKVWLEICTRHTPGERQITLLPWGETCLSWIKFSDFDRGIPSIAIESEE